MRRPTGATPQRRSTPRAVQRQGVRRATRKPVQRVQRAQYTRSTTVAPQYVQRLQHTQAHTVSSGRMAQGACLHGQAAMVIDGNGVNARHSALEMPTVMIWHRCGRAAGWSGIMLLSAVRSVSSTGSTPQTPTREAHVSRKFTAILAYQHAKLRMKDKHFTKPFHRSRKSQ